MQSDPDSKDTPTEDDENHAGLAALVKLSLVEVGDMRDIAERTKDVVERISKLTPPPQPPPPND